MVVVTVVASIALGVPIASGADQSDPEPVPIDSCADLTEIQSDTIILTSDINASDGGCLSVEYSRYTVLGNGHTIRGNGTGIGIEVGGDGVEIRNVTVTGFETGIFLDFQNTLNLYDSTVANNSRAGIAVDDVSDLGIWRSTIADNGVGVTVASESSFEIYESRIVDNERHGIESGDAGGIVTRSVIAGNGGMGIDNSDIPPEFSFVDARFNYWGAADGPSGPAGSGPIADPATGRIVDGGGDKVSVYIPGPSEPVPETTVSNVRFDPFLTSPLGESTYDGHYQVDLVVGDPISQLSAERLYTDERRLVGFLHGQGDEVERTGTPPTLDPEYADCLEILPWGVENGTATVEFTVEEGCDLPSQPREPPQLTLVSYEKPTEGFSRETADQQRLYDFTQTGVRDGTYVLTVDLPEASTDDENDSVVTTSALDTPSAAFTPSLVGVR